jgi:hypothetical protein
MTEKSFWTSEQDFHFNVSEVEDILLILDMAQVPDTRRRKRWHYRGRRAGYLMRLRRRVDKTLLHSNILANVQSLENKLDKLRSRLSFPCDLKTVISYVPLIRGWTRTWKIYIFSIHRQDRTAGVFRGGVVCLFVNHSCRSISNIKEYLYILYLYSQATPCKHLQNTWPYVCVCLCEGRWKGCLSLLQLSEDN